MRSDVNQRVQELKKAKGSLPDEIYLSRKQGIINKLIKLLPAGIKNEINLIKDGSGEYISNSQEIARLLTEHWQKTFDKKACNCGLRLSWLECIRDRFKVSIEELRPTQTDVETLFKRLHDSAAGPDGISTALYRKLKSLAPDIFLRLALDMIDGKIQVAEDFNFAFLCCIPKTPEEIIESGKAVYTLGATRPLSIVDAANRIIAGILNIALERCIANKISSMQQGFVPRRQMLKNVIDIDAAAQTISVQNPRGALILFDFRAAFPSMDHQFIWDTLEIGGLPREFIHAIQILYRSNKHYLRLGGKLFDRPVVYSGVRQGCPLSGLLFAMCADALLKHLEDALQDDGEIARAFADDTAVAVADYVTKIPIVSRICSEYEQISGWQLNIDKTVHPTLACCQREESAGANSRGMSRLERY